MRIIVLFDLKDGVSISEYEDWARTRDIPGVNALGSVANFSIHKAVGVFGDSTASPPYQYFEIIDIDAMDGFVADISNEEFQAAAAPFQEYAADPVFVLTEDL